MTTECSIGMLDLGLSLPELTALELTGELSAEELTQAMEDMHLRDLTRFARALGLPSRGNWQTVHDLIIAHLQGGAA